METHERKAAQLKAARAAAGRSRRMSAAPAKAPTKPRNANPHVTIFHAEPIQSAQESAARALGNRAEAFRKGMAPLAAAPAVQTIRELREGISKLLTTILKDPRRAAPVFFGQHRKPQAVVLSYEVYQNLLDALEDAQLALQVKPILDAGGTESYEDIMSMVDLGPES